MPSLANEARYAVRRLAAAPGFTIAAALMLALGIGANTTIFSLVNAVLLRPPAHVLQPDRLVMLFTSDFSGPAFGASSFPDFEAFAEQRDVFDGVLAYEPRRIGVGEGDEMLRTQAEVVSARYFEVLGVRLQAGRGFAADEALRGGVPVAVISDALWRSRFNAEPSAIGGTIRLNGNAFTLVGVAPAGYAGALRGLAVDVWVPASSTTLLGGEASDMTERGNRSWFVIGRLRDGISVDAAQTQMNVVAQRLFAAYPDYCAT